MEHNEKDVESASSDNPNVVTLRYQKKMKDSPLFIPECRHNHKSSLMTVVHHKWRKILKRDAVRITQDDPSCKVTYLGNVVTTWAKGEGCLNRPASALWKNHSEGRGSIKMEVKVTPSGLKAFTREHGLTEYWSNRLTWCGVPRDYPKLFCWIYRHEGRKLKQELRCHAVLCSKEERAEWLSKSLKDRLAEALFDFRREKIIRQNSRLSVLHQSLYNNQLAAKRKFLLITSNSHNYKPPLERSKSAPKLSCIEEFDEEDEENVMPRFLIPPTVVTTEEMKSRLNEMFNEAEESTSPVKSKDEETEARDIVPMRPVPPPRRHSRGKENLQESIRPNTIPMDSKLNLPYLTGYEKVMHLLSGCKSCDPLLLANNSSEGYDSYPESDPLASCSCPSSNKEDDDSYVLQEADDSDSSAHVETMKSTSFEEDDGEINDNFSDESGFAEDGRRCSGFSSSNDSTTASTPAGEKQNKKSLVTLVSDPLTEASCGIQSAEGSFKSSLVVYRNLSFEV